MYKEELKPSNLAKTLLVFNYVFVDTCSLMDDSFPVFMDLLAKSRGYWKKDVKVIILGEVIEELKKHSADKEEPAKRVCAARALKIINHDKKRCFGLKKTFEIRKPISNDPFADPVLYTEVSSLRIKNKILVITQDKALAYDLRNLNEMGSQKGRFVSVKKLNKDAELEDNFGAKPETPIQSRKNGGASTPKRLVSKNERKQLPVTKTAKDFKSAPSLSESLLLIQANDKRISANISNPNYPDDRKASDIKSQLTLLNKEDKKDIASLSLNYDAQKLSETLKKFEVQTASNKQIQKQAPKTEVTPQKEEKPKTEPKNKIWYEFGSTPLDAAIKSFTNSSIIPHKKEVEYIKTVHGDANVVLEDLQKKLNKWKFEKTGDKHEMTIAPYVLSVEKTEKDFKATIKKGQEKKPKEKKEEVSSKEAPVQNKQTAEVVVKTAPKTKSSAKKAKEKEPQSVEDVQKPKQEAVSENKEESKSKDLEVALASEKTLRCNVNNPNYPTDSKIKALEEQLARIRSLKDNDRRKLGWGIREIQHRLNELKK